MLKVDRKGGIAVVVLKYMKVLSAFIIIVALCFVNNVKAEISEDEYAELREIFSEARLSIMSDAEKEELVNGNLTIDEKIYQITKTVNDTYTYSEIDSDLYETLMDNYNNGITPMDAYHETSYKRIQIIDNYIGGNTHSILVYTQWLVTPATKSYDVTAMRIDGGYIVDGTQDGTQTFWKNGEYDYVDYSWNGTNIRKSDNGFGISMNLVDGASYFETDISANVISTSQNSVAYGTYQHAVTDVSLSQSQSYTISHNGLGDVLNFATSVHNYYDRMAGVSISLAQ